MRDGSLVDGDLDQVLLSHLGTLGDCRGDLIGLTQAVADNAIAVANDHDGGEGESATTLGNLGGAVDSNQTLLEFGVGSDLYSIIFIQHDVVCLEFKSAFACAVGQRFNSTMEQEAIAVKHYSVDASLEGFLGNGLAHLSGDFALVALGDSLRGS